MTLASTNVPVLVSASTRRESRIVLVARDASFDAAGAVLLVGHHQGPEAQMAPRLLPGQDLGRIFKKYYRSAGASGFKGTGLGLAISRAIVEAHGGGISVESTEGKGSRFTVMLSSGEPERDGAGSK